MYGGFTFGHVYGFNKPKKAKKAAKPPKDNWFERLSNDELKSLCRSAKLLVSGTKAELVARLLEDQSTARFGVESKASVFRRDGEYIPGTDGETLESLKDQCKNAGLGSTGSKFKLVERLVQHAHGTGAPKRAANVMLNPDGSTAYDENGKAVVKKRKVGKPTKPNLDKIKERMRAAIFVDKRKWSDAKYKAHASVVCETGDKIITAEVEKKTCFLDERDPIAYKVCVEVIRAIDQSWDGYELTGQGRCSWELRGLLESVEFFIGEGKPAAGMTEEEIKRDEFQIERVAAQRWCTSLRAKYREYVGENLEKSFCL